MNKRSPTPWRCQHDAICDANGNRVCTLPAVPNNADSFLCGRAALGYRDPRGRWTVKPLHLKGLAADFP
jgi:hypothetical protein